MTARCAEIVFLTGPQAGQRNALTTNPVLVGRSSESDVRVLEPYVSRQHFRMVLTRDGWMLINLTKKKIRINGKKFNAAKRLILDTSDVIDMGAETHLMFVSAGDDAEAALAAWREANPQLAARESDTQLPEGYLPDIEAPDEQEEVAPEPMDYGLADAPEGDLAEQAEVDAATDMRSAGQAAFDDERKRKVKRYAILFGGYLLVLLAVGVLLMLRSGGKQTRAESQRPVLTRTEIRRQLIALPKVTMKEDPAPFLQQAKRLYQRRIEQPDNLYKSVRNFKLHLAHAGLAAPQVTDDELMFKAAVEELLDTVMTHYNEAVRREKARQWHGSWKLFDLLLQMLPAREGDPAYPLVENVEEHLKFVKRKATEDKCKAGYDE